MGNPKKMAPVRAASFEREAVAALVRELGMTHVCAQVFASRGLTTPQAVRTFLHANIQTDWRDPYEIPGLKEVAERISEAITLGQRMCIFGDYDLDGISASALLARGLRKLGSHVEVVLPHRLEDGYGLSATGISRIQQTQPDLLITVDTGISSRDEVDQILALGIDVVVTDHHEPGDMVPLTVPVANPKLNPHYGVPVAHGGCGPEIAGAGVALKTLQAICSLQGEPDLWKNYIDLATLGTVADVMPLTGENRALVKAGVARMQTDPSLGIEALALQANFTRNDITAERISFTLAPRLNAAGRVATPTDALNLLMTDNWDEAVSYAEILCERNTQRQAAEQELMQGVLAAIEQEYNGEKAIIIAGEYIHDGVKGIVASRISDRYNVPTFLCSIENGVASGSGRSVGSVDLFVALEACSDHLQRWGGHSAAAGLAVKLENFDAFKTAFLKHLDTLPKEQFITQKIADANVHLSDVSLNLVTELQQLEPFGARNTRPLLLANSISINSPNCVGKNGEHLKFSAISDNTKLPAIYFRCPHVGHALNSGELADMAFHIEEDSWQGRKRINILVQQLDILREPTAVSQDRSEFLVELYEYAEDTVNRREYDGILDAPSFYTKLAGVTFDGRQDLIAQLTSDDELELQRDVANIFDPMALAVFAPRIGRLIGFLNRELASVLAPAIDEGIRYQIELASISGGEDGRSRGVNVVLQRMDLVFGARHAANYRMSQRELFEAMTSEELEAQLVRHFIGDCELHKAQAVSLDALSKGTNSLTIMATGRGKSLIFHMHAAKTALIDKKASVFVYPLRALVTDQAYHLESTFAEIGLSVAVVTGESSNTARAESFESLREGRLDVILTTPEFLHFHADKFAESQRIGFVVVDEAHHIGQAKAGNRPAYAKLHKALQKLGYPTTLAVTATAGDEVADAICASLDIHNRILDPHVRDNLVIADQRNSNRKDSYVTDLVAAGGKVVVYVNSRQESINLARHLRKTVPELAWRVAFYNGGLAQGTRQEIERRFRTGRIQVVIATSAFGEGVNIPDVRHVVLYHMPFSDVEFNQMAGRGGRDNDKATVHLLFGKRDARINERILGSLAPSREECAAMYTVLRDCDSLEGKGFALSNDALAQQATTTLRTTGTQSKLNDKAASVAIGVFKELGFITTEGNTAARRITLNSAPAKIELTSSVRYSEGIEEIEDFAQFKQWVMTSDAEVLLNRFNKPILPVQNVVNTKAEKFGSW